MAKAGSKGTAILLMSGTTKVIFHSLDQLVNVQKNSGAGVWDCAFGYDSDKKRENEKIRKSIEDEISHRHKSNFLSRKASFELNEILRNLPNLVPNTKTQNGVVGDTFAYASSESAYLRFVKKRAERSERGVKRKVGRPKKATTTTTIAAAAVLSDITISKNPLFEGKSIEEITFLEILNEFPPHSQWFKEDAIKRAQERDFMNMKRREDRDNKKDKSKKRKRRKGSKSPSSLIKINKWECYTPEFIECFVKLLDKILSQGDTKGWTMRKMHEYDGKTPDELIKRPGSLEFEKNVICGDKRPIVRLPSDFKCYQCRCKMLATRRRNNPLDRNYKDYVGIHLCELETIGVVCLPCACFRWLDKIKTKPKEATNCKEKVDCRQRQCAKKWGIKNIQFMKMEGFRTPLQQKIREEKRKMQAHKRKKKRMKNIDGCTSSSSSNDCSNSDGCTSSDKFVESSKINDNLHSGRDIIKRSYASFASASSASKEA